MQFAKFFLWAGIAAPVLYFGNLLFSALFYPGYSHLTQFASELGGPDAPHPAIFNAGAMATGVVTMLAGFGLLLALTRLMGNIGMAGLTGLAVTLFGVSSVLAGWFPMPDERHNAFYLGLAVYTGPLLAALALLRRKEWRTLVLFLLVNGVLMLAPLTVMVGVGGLVTPANVGLWQRFQALTAFPWLGVTSYFLLRALVASTAGQHTPASTALAAQEMAR
jgi:hypothetical membrane protein